MATVVFRGDATAVAQVNTATFGGTWIVGETITVTIGGKSSTYTIASATIATFLTALAAALDALTVPEFAESAWTANSTQLIQTSSTAGKSVTFTIATNSASGTIGSVTVATANDGPAVYSAKNGSGGALPTTGDTLILENHDGHLRYALAAVTDTLAAAYLEASFTGEVGLPRRNVDGDEYFEWRDRYLGLRVTTLVIGDGDGDGSGRLQIDLGSVQSAVRVLKTATSAEDGFHALRLKGTHASNTLEVTGDCSVDLAPEADDTATFATITASGNAVLRISRRVTVGTLIVDGNAQVEFESATALTDVTLIRVQGQGRLVLRGDNAITTLTIVESGSVDDRGKGTITTLNKGPRAAYTTADNTWGAGQRVLTNTTLHPGPGAFENSNKAATFTNPIDLGLGALRDFPNLRLGSDINVQIS